MNIFRSALLALAAVSALSPAAFAHEDHDKPEFSYTFPDSVKAHPALAAQLEKRKAEIKTEFDKDLADASEDSKLNNYQYQTDWKVDSETPDFLVLLSSNYTNSGGAHGMSGAVQSCGTRSRARKSNSSTFSPIRKKPRPRSCSVIARCLMPNG